MSLADHIPTPAEIAARRARMGFAPASKPVVRIDQPDIKAVRRLNKERMTLRLERLAEKRALQEQPAAPAVDQVSELVAKYREVKTPQGNKRIIETQHVVAAIAKRHGVTFDDIMGPGRKRNIVAARHEAIITVAKLRHTWSLPQIGRFFGDRDHTTILYTIKKMAIQTGETIKGYTPEEAAHLIATQREKNRAAIEAYRQRNAGARP